MFVQYLFKPTTKATKYLKILKSLFVLLSETLVLKHLFLKISRLLSASVSSRSSGMGFENWSVILSNQGNGELQFVSPKATGKLLYCLKLSRIHETLKWTNEGDTPSENIYQDDRFLPFREIIRNIRNRHLVGMRQNNSFAILKVYLSVCHKKAFVWLDCLTVWLLTENWSTQFALNEQSTGNASEHPPELIAHICFASFPSRV